MSEQAELGFQTVKIVLHYGENVYFCGDDGMTTKIAEATVFGSETSARFQVKRLKDKNPTLPLPKLCRIR